MTEHSSRSRFLQTCLQDLSSAGILFCVARNHHEFWKKGLSDVDLIVSPDALGEVTLLLVSAARGNDYQLVAKTLFDNLSLTFHSTGAGFVRLDLDTAVRWRTRTLLSAKNVLEKRIECDGLPIPAPEHEILILLCQCAWSGKVKASYRKRIEDLMHESRTARQVAGFLDSGFGLSKDALSKILTEGDIHELRQCFKLGKRQQRLRNTVSLLVRTLGRGMHPPGLVICRSGVDDNEIIETSRNLEFLSPVAKAAWGSAALSTAMLAVFRGGIYWIDSEASHCNRRFMRFWVGAKRYFQYEGGEISHPSTGSSASARDAADFIANTLANGITGPQ